MSASVTLFEDIFQISSLNPEGKKFDKVNRIAGTGTSFQTSLLLDTNSQIYPLAAGERITLVLASTLSLTGSPDDGGYNQSIAGGRDQVGSLADQYEYVMHGKVFVYKHLGDGRVEIQASYGGLLMRLEGEHKVLNKIQPDGRLYLLIKKG
ncbi:hypothetical protein TeGR_g6048 [Tetraparma gracilis]|jgi:DNA-directed RNA polymerase I, II, and III subunit RPABC3|uniref:DNA-directed RNA polymerases I, II, and III subunit RPABC3 n=1 Tax=Tetraparma gracilis TaxID=2962635 RepID=A0ABQ6MEW5_9STRA|nr:hypothetical protein TeGR_g6048 [Tetraparma gracilis]